MLVLHSLWDTKSFYIWAESSALPLTSAASQKRNKKSSPQTTSHSSPSPHPFAPPPGDLCQSISELFPSDSGREQTLVLRLPCSNADGNSDPLPSPWLLREDYAPCKPSGLVACTVPALGYDPGPAVDQLLDLPARPPPGTAFADSMLFWSQLAFHSLELVTKELFVPAVRGSNAVWRAVLDESAQKRLALFPEAMPPSCLCLLPPPGLKITSGRLISSFVDGAVDHIVRGSLSGVSLLPVRRGRKPLSLPPVHQLCQALTAPNPALKASAGEVKLLADDLESWTAQLQPKSVDVPFRTCFRLEAPARNRLQSEIGLPDESDSDDDIDDDVNDDDNDDDYAWHLLFFLQARDDPSLLVPASDVWRTRSGALTILKKRLKNPQEQLLADLGKAARVFPTMAKCLENPRPSDIRMTTEEAYSFLRESAPLLEQNGYGVQLPAWWERPGSRLGIKIKLLDPPERDGKVGPSSFGLDTVLKYDWQLSLGGNAITEAEFAELSRLKIPLVRIRGEWMELKAEEIEKAIEFFRTNENREMTLAEALRMSANMAGPDSPDGLLAMPIQGIEAEGRIDEMLRALNDPAGRIKTALPPRDLQGTLRPYQLRGVSWLEYLHSLGFGACLADDMGLGKTVELIAFLLRQREKNLSSNANTPARSKPSLLICPMSVAGNWQRELQRFAPGLKVHLHHGQDRLCGQDFQEAATESDVVVTTYALAQRDEEELCASSWGNLVLDEAQNIKNRFAHQTKSIKKIKADYRIALTGTPVENRLSELWSILDFLNPGFLGSPESFRKEFVLPIEKHKSQSRSERLRATVQPFILRRLKTDASVISDLPMKTEMLEGYSLTAEQASLYSAVVNEMLGEIELSDGIERKGLILSALTKLKQICDHPALFLQDGSSLGARSGKLSRLEEMLDEVLAEGDRSIIFTQFAAMGAMLRHQLQETLGVEALFLHGGTSKKKRDEMIQRFQSGSVPIFILSLKAGGFGLNLTAANQVFHYDRWWNPAVENQATDRAFRIGQKKNVFVHKFVCPGTLEEQIDQLIVRKKALAESVIGTGESWLTELSNDALRDILSLRLTATGHGGD